MGGERAIAAGGPASSWRAAHGGPDLRTRLRFCVRKGREYWASSGRRGGRIASPIGRMRDLASGFDPAEADWYRQIHGDLSGLVTNAERERHLHGLNRHHAALLDNKALLGLALAGAGIPSPRTFAIFTDGRWTFPGGGEEALGASLARNGRFVIKPIMGSKGRSIVIAESLDEIRRYRGEDALATAFVRQHPYAQGIFCGALATIRLLMMRDGEGRAVLAAATHRFGTRLSGPVDNFSRGGVVADVDRQTGRLAKAVDIAPDNTVRFMAGHPDTGAAIEGVAVPHWDSVLRLVARLGEVFPFLAYVGWDVAVTEEGPVVIEGNAHPSLRFFQFYHRLLADPELAPIFARHLGRGA